MGIYDSQIATAKRLIAARGEKCVWVSSTPGEVDPAKPWNAAQSVPVEYLDVPIAFFPLSRQWSQFVRFARGSDIVTGDLYGLMAATDFTPQLTDTVRRKDGTILSIVNSDPLAPSGDVIIHTIEFKK